MHSLNASILPRKALNRNLSWVFPLGNLLPKTRVLKHRVLERKRRPNANASVLGTQRFRTLRSRTIPLIFFCLVVFLLSKLPLAPFLTSVPTPEASQANHPHFPHFRCLHFPNFPFSFAKRGPCETSASRCLVLSGPTARVILSRYTVALHSVALRFPRFGGVPQKNRATTLKGPPVESAFLALAWPAEL